jgi:hypothetical protein
VAVDQASEQVWVDHARLAFRVVRFMGEDSGAGRLVPENLAGLAKELEGLRGRRVKGFKRSPFTVRRLAFGVRHSASNVWGSSFKVERLKVQGVAVLTLSSRHPVTRSHFHGLRAPG